MPFTLPFDIFCRRLDEKLDEALRVRASLGLDSVKFENNRDR